MTARAIRLHRTDPIAVLLVPASAGEQITVDGIVIQTDGAIPMGHKVALRRIEAAEDVRRYGEVIGHATCDIEPGQHVHTQNLVGNRLSVEVEA